MSARGGLPLRAARPGLPASAEATQNGHGRTGGAAEGNGKRSRSGTDPGAHVDGAGPVLETLVHAADPALEALVDGARPASLPHASNGADELEAVVGRLLELLGEDPEREGLQRTPERVSRALRYLTSGYGRTARDALGDAVFEQEHGGIVLVRDIEFHSLCEHHLLPFHGRVHVGYLPDGEVVGLSKLARLVNVFARRLQVQERLTDQVARGLDHELRPAGVAVAVEAKHMCMSMRGVEQPHAETLTTSYLGRFLEDAAARGEFLRLALRA